MRDRNPEYEFFSTDPETIVAELKEKYEAITEVTVHQGSAEMQFIQWVASVLVQERAMENYAMNQSFPSRAEGENLDALAELYYGSERPAAKSAVCTVRFHISAAQAEAIIIHAGTRVTDAGKTMVWSTEEDVMIPAGETYADAKVVCQTPGAAGNGYGVGQLSAMVDLYDYCQKVENITASDGGEDEATDKEFYELLRASMDSPSAGTYGGYVYAAKRVSTEIADVVPVAKGEAEIAIYLLMRDGKLASEEMKDAVLASVEESDRRIMTDHVSVADPGVVSYDIAFTYYISEKSTASSGEIKEAVEVAVEEYVAWQCGKLGRDINPDELRRRLYETGVKRIVLTSPEYTRLRSGRDNTVPQVAQLGKLAVKNGGFEDE